MSVEVIREVAKNNEAFSRSHAQSLGLNDVTSIKATVVISCMDPRANPNEYWSFDEASPVTPVVLRNAGGRVTEDTLRSIRVVAALMTDGKTTHGAVAVVHHTDCGLRNLSNEQLRDMLKKCTGSDAEKAKEIDELDFRSWAKATSAEESVKEDMEIIKRDPYLPRDLEVVGYVYDISDGKTTEVAVI